MAIKNAPAHKRRKSRKRYRVGESVPVGATVNCGGIESRVGLMNDSDYTLTMRMTDALDIVRIQSEVRHEIVSSESELCCVIRQHSAGNMARKAIHRLHKTYGDLKVTIAGSRDTWTLETLLATSGSGEIAAVCESGSLVVDLPDDRVKTLGLPPCAEFTEPRTRLTSSSSGHDAPLGKRVNTGSKPSRERRVDDLPSVNEVDRKESGNGPDLGLMDQAGNQRDIKRERESGDHWTVNGLID